MNKQPTTNKSRKKAKPVQKISSELNNTQLNMDDEECPLLKEDVESVNSSNEGTEEIAIE